MARIPKLDSAGKFLAADVNAQIDARTKATMRADLPALAVTALGVVVGFPLLTALALQHVTSAHSIVFVGLLPLCTALFAVLRGGERPRPAFWLFSAAGAACVGMGGLLVYADVAFVHPDAQGGLAFLTVPLAQWAATAGLAAIAAILVAWQHRSRRT